MPKLQNPIDATVVIPGTPAFAPGECREVTDAEAVFLLDGTPLVLLRDPSDEDPSEEPPKKRTPKSPPA